VTIGDGQRCGGGSTSRRCREEAARDALAAARARLRSIADRIADPAYRRSFLEAVPENARTLALARSWLGEPPG
jgi:hypothetical protein